MEATESDPDRVEMLEFLNQEFKNNSDYYAKNSNGYRGQWARTVGNVSREKETKKKSKGNSRNQNTVTEMKNGFDGLTRRLGMVGERISDPEGM